jgi:hypothetical protein
LYKNGKTIEGIFMNGELVEQKKEQVKDNSNATNNLGYKNNNNIDINK